MKKTKPIPEEFIASKIYRIREQNVMLDRDIAKLYDVETRVLKQAVRRNISRFPDDFMFEMRKEEFEDWRSQNVTSKADKKGLRYAPFCFTEQGVAMLSSVLGSDKAIAMNILIIRTFVRLRELLSTNNELLLEINKMRQEVGNNSKDIELIFQYLKQLEKAKQQEFEQQNRKAIGFKRKGQT